MSVAGRGERLAFDEQTREGDKEQQLAGRVRG